MKFDTKAATPKLTFKAVRPLTEDEYAISVEQGVSSDAQQAIKLTVFKQNHKEDMEEDKAPAPKPKAKKPAVVEEDDDVPPPPKAKKPAVVEEDDEPVVAAKAKASAAPAGKRPAADVIAEWDDE